MVGGGGSAAGGGIYVADGSLVLNNDVFDSNYAVGGGGGGGGEGGGLFASGATLTMNGATIDNNSAIGGVGGTGGGPNHGPPDTAGPGGSGGSGQGGGLFVSASALTLNGATIAHDSAVGGAGGEGGNAQRGGTGGVGGSGEGGGLFDSAAPLALNGTTIARDTAVGGVGGVAGSPGGASGAGGSGEGGGLFDSAAPLTLKGTTIAHDTAVGGVGGVAGSPGGASGAGGSGEGGGIFNDGNLTVTNSTIADNSAGNGGGITSESSLTTVNSTIAYNDVVNGGAGGGLDVIAGTSLLDNTIVALNTAGAGSTASASDIAGTADPASAYNLVGTGGAGGLTNGVNGNQVGVANPGLGPLADNGGPTQTIALVTGSPAIDMGSNALAVDPVTGQPLTTDQRGPGFVRIVNGRVDIGAYEFTPDADDVLSVGWGTQTAALQTAADGLRLLPAGRATDIPWLGINQLPITVSQAYSLTAADVFISSAIGVNYGPVTVSGSGTNYTITLAQPINAADLVTLIVDNPGISIFNRRLDVLPGDFNDDGVVNSQDLAGIRNEWLGVGGAKPTIFGDINGDGLVNVLDYNAERLLIGTSLPLVSDVSLASVPGSQSSPAVVRIGTSGPSPPATASPAPPRAEIQLSGRGSSLGTSAIGTTINQALIEKSTTQDAKRLTRSFDLRRMHRLSSQRKRLTDAHDRRSRNEDTLHDKR